MPVKARRRIVIWVEYEGTEFNGWQFQPGQRTVQGEIEAALTRMVREPVRIIASGRTDSGVHALAQVAHFDSASPLCTKKFRMGLNSILERDASIIDCREALKPFHAQYDAIRKTYRYRFLRRRAPSAIRRNHVWHHKRKLDIAAMRRAAADLVGEHDFASFCPERVEVSSTVRNLEWLDVIEAGDEIHIEATASGFLRFMVRNLVGTLAEVGRGERPADSMRKILEARDRNQAGLKAPAHGLCLVEVDYGDKLPPPADDGGADSAETT